MVSVFFAVVDVLGCLKGTRALTPCRAPRPTQEGLGSAKSYARVSENRKGLSSYSGRVVLQGE